MIKEHIGDGIKVVALDQCLQQFRDLIEGEVAGREDGENTVPDVQFVVDTVLLEQAAERFQVLAVADNFVCE